MRPHSHFPRSCNGRIEPEQGGLFQGVGLTRAEDTGGIGASTFLLPISCDCMNPCRALHATVILMLRLDSCRAFAILVANALTRCLHQPVFAVGYAGWQQSVGDVLAYSRSCLMETAAAAP